MRWYCGRGSFMPSICEFVTRYFRRWARHMFTIVWIFNGNFNGATKKYAKEFVLIFCRNKFNHRPARKRVRKRDSKAHYLHWRSVGPLFFGRSGYTLWFNLHLFFLCQTVSIYINWCRLSFKRMNGWNTHTLICIFENSWKSWNDEIRMQNSWCHGLSVIVKVLLNLASFFLRLAFVSFAC